MAGDVYAGDCYHGDVTFERCAVEYKWTFEPVVVGYEEGLTVRGFGRVALFLPAKILEKNELSEAYDAMYTITLTAKDETGMIGSSALSVGVNLGAQCEGTKCFAVNPVDTAIDVGSAMDTAFRLTCDEKNVKALCRRALCRRLAAQSNGGNGTAWVNAAESDITKALELDPNCRAALAEGARIRAFCQQ